jgi:hypothetical protein
MTGLTIHRLQHRLHLTRIDPAHEARLRRLLATLLDAALEPALERRGLSSRGETCIRRIDLPPLRIDLAAGDADIVARLADAWALVLARRLAQGDADVVQYASRVHALLDVASAASMGDLRRAWAWRQLGLWSGDAAVTRADAAGLVMRALLAEARHAPSALAWLAARPDAFARWLRAARGEALQRLAAGVLKAAGADPAALQPQRDELRAGDVHAPAARVLARSALARALAPAAPLPSRDARVALALLAVADVEPSLLAQPAPVLAALLGAIARRWADTPASAGDVAGAVDDARAADDQRARAGADGDPRRVFSIARSRPTPQPPWVLAGEQGTAVAEEPLPQPRRRAMTSHGGLLFLLHLASGLGWPDRLLRDPVLAPRGLRWSLHALAQRLLPLAPDDPAVLAFAGLRPQDDPPDRDEAPPGAAEAAALDVLRAETIAALRRRLRAPPAEDADLLAGVCRRRAEVQADPGWIEIHFSLDDVRSEIRVAGLDLDPGWVPWLGVVIRFVYE